VEQIRDNGKGRGIEREIRWVVTASIEDRKLASGPFALQFATGAKGAPGGIIKWRKVQVRRLWTHPWPAAAGRRQRSRAAIEGQLAACSCPSIVRLDRQQMAGCDSSRSLRRPPLAAAASMC